MDKLEKFIIENKQAFDDERSPEAGWKRLDKKLNSSQRDWNVYWKVAAILFFVCSLVLAGMNLQQTESQPAFAQQQANIEEFYISQINYKKQEYNQLASAEQSEELMQDLEAFDLAYKELSQTFYEMKNEELAEAMLENLRLRVLILNEQIELLKNSEGDEEFYHSS